jgi:hypothetical protein
MQARSIETIEVRTVADYVREVLRISKRWEAVPSGVWFRGVQDAGYDLHPGVAWQGVADEDSIIEEFLISYFAIYGVRVADSWEAYGLMQHYGLPTRLLDWTKSPLMGLYFALEADPAKPNAVCDRAVWLIEPYELNEAIQSRSEIIVVRTDPGSSFESGEGVHAYLPRSLRDFKTDIPAKPVAIEPPLTNKRMLAQQGCFTVHGTDQTALNRMSGLDAVPMAKIVIPGEVASDGLREELHTLGLREDSVYQDLGSLAARIKREWRDRWGPAGVLPVPTRPGDPEGR